MVAEAIDVVIGPVRHDRLDREIGPLRKLPGEQATHERNIGVDLVDMHLGCGHGLIIAERRTALGSSPLADADAEARGAFMASQSEETRARAVEIPDELAGLAAEVAVDGNPNVTGAAAAAARAIADDR